MRLHFLRGSPKSPGLLERGRDSFFLSFSLDARSTPKVENEKAISIKRENYMVLDFFTPLEQFLPEKTFKGGLFYVVYVQLQRRYFIAA